MVRIKDIAKEAGVSPTTVSNVIHGNTKKVSKSNIDKIQKILEEHQYIPSMSALMLAQNRSRLIGVLIGGVDGKRRSIEGDPFTSIMLSALELEIYRKNYYMLFHLQTNLHCCHQHNIHLNNQIFLHRYLYNLLNLFLYSYNLHL